MYAQNMISKIPTKEEAEMLLYEADLFNSFLSLQRC